MYVYHKNLFLCLTFKTDLLMFTQQNICMVNIQNFSENAVEKEIAH